MASDITFDQIDAGTATGDVSTGMAAYLPDDLRQTLDTRQLSALERAAHQWVAARGRRTPVDIRFSLPLPIRGIFVNVLAGSERRSRARRHAEHRRRPLASVGNVIFTACLVGVLYSGLLIGALAFSGIVE